MVRVITLAALALAAASPAAHAADRSPASGALKRLVAATGGDARDAGTARYAHLRKLDGRLQNLAADALGASKPPPGALRETALPVTGGAVPVDVYVDGNLDAAAAALRDLGMRVTAISRRAPQRLIEGRLPVDALTVAARLGRTRAIIAVAGEGTNAGSVTSEGDASHRGPQARALGPTGAGVTVGVVSDSIDRVGGGVADSQASGDLPSDVVVLDGGPTTGSDEGRAMAEIIYDGAPGVPKMVFHTGSGAANRAGGIDELVAAGARVISDDMFQITEPFFQDGIVAQAVDRAHAAGVSYLVSAGNRARQSWQGTYSGGASNDFDPSAATDTAQRLGTFSNRDMFISLQWDEPWGDAEIDLALDFYNLATSSTTPALTVNTDNLTTGLPSEFASVRINGTVDVGIGIRRLAGTRSPFMKYIVGGTPAFTIAEHNVPTAGAIDPDASSALGALTIGAVDHADPGFDTAESFSSRGPAFRLFDVAGDRLPAMEVRPKPDLAGADGVATSVPGFEEFFGTSAGAPSAAGVAALVRSADPALPVDGVAAVLKAADPIDCTSAAGFPDLDCGFGLPLADAAVRKALDATPPGVNGAVAPGAPTGAGGFYTGGVGVSWSVSDAESPVFASSGCGPSNVTADGASTLTCTATSAGGTTTQSVTVNRDASPPSPPAIAGIAAQTYQTSTVPAASAISCSASDPTSGVTSCAVGGHSAAVGTHTLTATAVNGAGLSSTSTLSYTVVAAPVAAPVLSKLSLRKGKIRYTVSTAAEVTFTVARCANKKCTRVKKAAGRFTQNAKAGTNTKTIPKKVGGKRLKKARYRITVQAAAGGKRSKAKRLSFIRR